MIVLYTPDHPALERAALQACTGTYAAEDSQSSVQMLSVQLEQDTLALHGPRTRYDTLVPVSTTRFHLRATRVDTEFVVEEGLARRLVLLMPDGTTQVFPPCVTTR